MQDKPLFSIYGSETTAVLKIVKPRMAAVEQQVDVSDATSAKKINSHEQIRDSMIEAAKVEKPESNDGWMAGIWRGT